MKRMKKIRYSPDVVVSEIALERRCQEQDISK